MHKARLALAALWFSQVGRTTADNCLRTYVVLLGQRRGAAAAENAWYLGAALFVLPALLLAPMNGALSNSLPKRRVLLGSAAYCLGIMFLFSAWNARSSSEVAWLWCLGLVAVGNALYSPARYGMLPAAARDGRLPLSSVNGWIEMGSVTSILGGLFVAGRLFAMPSAVGQAWPAMVLAMLGLNAVGLLAALPVAFPSDVHRPEASAEAVAGFFRDFRRIFALGETRGYLLGLSGLRALVMASVGPLLYVLTSHVDFVAGPESVGNLVSIAVLVGMGAAAGSLLASLQGHPVRSLGMVPFAATGFVAGLGICAVLQAAPWWLCFWIGAMGAVVNVPLLAAYQAALPADARGNGIAILNTSGYAGMIALVGALGALGGSGTLGTLGRLWLIVGLAAVAAVLAWKFFLTDAYEQLMEFVFRPAYKVTGHGPGLDSIPRTGPLLVMANHSAWFDPVWLACVLPRRLTGMLTSQFYDKPVLRFLCRHAVRIIRVEDSRFRREAPELNEAVAALDRGEAVMIFPEGQLRKREDWTLHPFGRGIWFILKERPHTPVLICWIEGGWGSWASYFNGPPMINKRLDWRRPIDVAVCNPQVIDPELLADHRLTRNYLMQACLEARRILGLEPVTRKEMPATEPEGSAPEGLNVGSTDPSPDLPPVR